MESLNMTKEEKKVEGMPDAVSLPFISGKSPEIVNLPKGVNPVPTPQASDKTVEGGRYLVNGVLVNCNGEPIKE
jgi:hypothetical protein